ncbi:MAG: single-stranded DNA-binding protein [Chroococcidiopsidaceae cyanobacterium CP_BM_ER_R8_30]|nr:single-stranded DNA-binding protein [Chroococcidiopsidaceae cyanobacterium CP_BM_ER_R8_30]
MNSCILMAEIVQDPQLRYTSDTNLAIADMLVQFPGLRAEDPPATLKVVGWGNLATEIQQNYHQGDRIIIEGRLNMNTIEREGFKEKRAELTAQRIHPVGEGVSLEGARPRAANNAATFSTSSPQTSEIVESGVSSSGSSIQEPTESAPQPKTPKVPAYQSSMSEPDVDDIPF